MPVGMLGLTSDFDSQKLIDKLVEVEKKPIKRMEDEKQIIGLKIEVLNAFENELIRLRESTKSLYGINSVFRNKEAFGADSDAFTVTPGAYALRGDTKLEIEQIAKVHSVASKPFDPATVFKAGTFTLSVGTNNSLVVFTGGSAADLAAAINKQCRNFLSAAIIKDTDKTVVLTITSKLTGQDNEIGASDPEGVFSVIPLLEKKKVSVFALNRENGFLESNWQRYKGSDQKLIQLSGSFGAEGNELLLSAASREIMMESLSIDSSYRMEISYRIRKHQAAAAAETETPGETGNTVFSRLFSAYVKDIEVKGVPFPVNDTPAGEEPTAPVAAAPSGPDIGAGVAYATANRREKLANLEASTDTVTALVDLDGAPEKINRILLWSASPDWDLCVQSIRIFSKRQKDVDFARILQSPQDAKFKVNDVEVRRPGNTVSDVIQDVTINLKAPTEKPVTFTVDYSYDDIAKELITFITNYNMVVGFIDDIQRTSKSDKPGEYNKEDQGIFSGDMVFATIKSKLRALVSAPYPTSLSNRLAVLFQVGISTGEWGSAFEETRKGRLKYNRSKFEEQFRETPEAVQELFSSDNNGDKKPDDGMAFRMDLFLADLVRAKSGIMDMKIEKTKEDMRQMDKQIANKEDQVNGSETKLKDQFMNMEKNMSELKAEERWLKLNSGENKKEDQ